MQISSEPKSCRRLGSLVVLKHRMSAQSWGADYVMALSSMAKGTTNYDAMGYGAKAFGIDFEQALAGAYSLRYRCHKMKHKG